MQTRTDCGMQNLSIFVGCNTDFQEIILYSNHFGLQASAQPPPTPALSSALGQWQCPRNVTEGKHFILPSCTYSTVNDHFFLNVGNQCHLYFEYCFPKKQLIKILYNL